MYYLILGILSCAIAAPAYNWLDSSSDCLNTLMKNLNCLAIVEQAGKEIKATCPNGPDGSTRCSEESIYKTFCLDIKWFLV
jgi:hypothetical protein